MTGLVWWSIVAVCGVLTVVMAAFAGDVEWMVGGVCAVIVGAGSVWHGERFSPRRMRRP
jgi:hypothetical protein